MFNLTKQDLGTEYKLAKEFEQFKAQHKYSVLVAKMIDYYETVMSDEILLPFDTAEKRAEEAVSILYHTNKQKFNECYEQAWSEIAPYMN